MIRYDLICDQGHPFDSWFRNSATLTSRPSAAWWPARSAIRHKVSKQLMAPGIPAKSNKKSDEPARVFTGPVDPRQQMLMKMMRELRKQVEKNADYVGDQFAEEARTHPLQRSRKARHLRRSDARRRRGADRGRHRGPSACRCCRKTEIEPSRRGDGLRHHHVVDGHVARLAPFAGERIVDDPGSIADREAVASSQLRSSSGLMNFSH